MYKIHQLWAVANDNVLQELLVALPKKNNATKNRNPNILVRVSTNSVMMGFICRLMLRCFFFKAVTFSDSPESFVSFSICLRTWIAILAKYVLRDIVRKDCTVAGTARAMTYLIRTSSTGTQAPYSGTVMKISSCTVAEILRIAGMTAASHKLVTIAATT